MKNEDVYRHWRQARRQITLSPDFPEKVMSRLAGDKVRRQKRRFGSVSLMERISVTPWARAAALAVAALLGIARALLTLHVLLFA